MSLLTNIFTIQSFYTKFNFRIKIRWGQTVKIFYKMADVGGG